MFGEGSSNQLVEREKEAEAVDLMAEKAIVGVATEATDKATK